MKKYVPIDDELGKKACKILENALGETNLICSPLVEAVGGTDDGICSSQFSESSKQSIGSRIDELLDGTVLKRDGKMHSYYFEIQRGNANPELFLAQISVLRGEKRYQKWYTNDKNYAKSHRNVFDENLASVESLLFGGVYKLKNGAAFSDKALEKEVTP